MDHEMKLLGAMFALNALLLAALLTVMLGLAPTPQSLLRAGAGRMAKACRELHGSRPVCLHWVSAVRRPSAGRDNRVFPRLELSGDRR